MPEGGNASHLDEDVRPGLLLPDAHRIARHLDGGCHCGRRPTSPIRTLRPIFLCVPMGSIGALTRLLRQAAVEAVRTGHERIDRAMLDRVSTTTLASIEALAVPERF